MLVVAPPSAAETGRFSRSDPTAPRFTPSGSWGDPTLASEETGRRLLDAMLDDLRLAVGDLEG